MNFPCRTPFSSLPQPIISPWEMPFISLSALVSGTAAELGWWWVDVHQETDPFLCGYIQLLFHSPQLTQALGCFFVFFYLRKPLSKNGKQKREKRFFFACVCVCVRVGGYFCFSPICHYFCKAENNPRATRKMGSEKADASHETLVWSETPFPSQINTGGKTAGSLEIKSDEVTQES